MARDRNEKLWAQFDKLKDINYEQALITGGGVFLRGIKRRSPVDTGAMRDSTRLEAREPLDGQPQIYIIVGDDELIYYPSFVEYGTVKMAAQPFVRPTLDEDLPAALKAMNSYLIKEMRVVAK